MNKYRWKTLAVIILLLAGCGGGGGNNESGSGSAVSGKVPYLLSKPTVTYAVNALDNTKYDVTVTVEADGPTGVAFADVWIFDDTGASFDHIDLINIVATKLWKGTTNTLVPLPPGSYRVDNITLHDGDPLSTDPLRSGWYIYNDIFSTSVYFVDERELSGLSFLYYNWGLSDISIARFTLP